MKKASTKVKGLITITLFFHTYKLENANPVNSLNINAYKTIANITIVNRAKALKECFTT